MLTNQKFKTDFGAIELIRDGELCTIRVYNSSFRDNEYDLTLIVNEFEELMKVLRNSPFIFSKNNV